MEELIVGKGPVKIQAIVKAMKSSVSFGMFLTTWAQFATNLDLEEEKILALKKRLNLEISQLGEVPTEVLRAWVSQNGSAATVKALCHAFETCELKDIAENIRELLQVKIIVNENIFNLHDVLNRDDPVYKVAYVSLLHATDTVLGEPVQLFREQLMPPTKPEYYIARTLSYTTQIDESIFRAETTLDHIFLIKGISKNDLAMVTGYQPIDVSTNQLHDITVRFIVLEWEEDFDRIQENTKMPVHLIEYKRERFYWIRSTQSLDTIKMFLVDESLHFNEVEFVNNVTETSNNRRSFCLADSPGMGKTLLLASIANKIFQQNPRNFGLFIVLQEFMQQIKSAITSRFSAIETLLEYVCFDKAFMPALREMLNCASLKLDIYFDGYDEIRVEKLDEADAFLQQINKLKSVRVFVTTRTHLKSRLERILKLVSFQILPFNEANQIEFLTKYWNEKYDINSGPQTQKYASMCLAELVKVMTDSEKKIAGVPLQCMMLAEVYSKDAKRYSFLPLDSLLEIHVKTKSIFEMYKSLVGTKFKKLEENLQDQQGTLSKTQKQAYVNAHVYAAFKLLFPDCVEKFICHLGGQEIVKEDQLFSIGLLEASPTATTPRFLHRTFAEFILADFIVKNIGKFQACVEFIMCNLLGEKAVYVENSMHRTPQYRLRYPVITYFLDRHLHGFLEYSDINESIIMESVRKRMITAKDVCIALLASCSHGFKSCFNLASKTLAHVNKNCDEWNDLKNEHLQHLPYIAVENLGNVSLLKDVLRLIKFEADLDLSYQVRVLSERKVTVPLAYQFQSIDNFKYPWIPGCSPLHVAIFHGNYQISAYLLNEYGVKCCNLKYVFHVCVRDSDKNCDAVIHEKIIIMKLLKHASIKHDINWLEEKLEKTDCTPILQDRVHQKLLQCLIDLGANINSCSKVHGTIVHRVCDTKTLELLLPWLLELGFNVVNFKDFSGLSALQCLIKRLGVLNSETLALVHKLGACFTSVDYEGQSVLFYAIETGCIDFLNRILAYSTDVNHVTVLKNNAGHKTIEHAKVCGWDSDLIVGVLNILVSHGFTKLNEPNNQGLTPLHIAMQLKNGKEVLEFFNMNAANFNAVDSYGNSILFHAIKHNQGETCLQMLLNYGAELNVRNNMMQNALHIAAFYSRTSAWNILLGKLSHNAVDCKGNAPIHLLLSTKSNTRDMFHSFCWFLRRGDFFLENNNGDVPIMKWIKHGWYVLSVLDKSKEMLHFTREIANKTFTALLAQTCSVENILTCPETERKSFASFTNYLISKGGKLYVNNERFDWCRISEFSMSWLDDVIDVDLILAKEINNKLLRPIDLNVPLAKFSELVDTFNIPVEILVSSLLSCERYVECFRLSKVATGFHSLNLQQYCVISRDNEKFTFEKACEIVLDWMPNCTPLHVASHYGSFDIVTSLIEEYGEEVSNIKYVVHACVRDSDENDDIVVGQKRLIIETLVNQNINWLEETFEYPGCTPLLQQNVHFKLLQFLVELGADINAYSPYCGTILHRAGSKSVYIDLFRWALLHDFKLVDERDSFGETPLLDAVSKFGVLDDATLYLFCQMGSDFNAEDNNGFSVLLTALQYTDNANYISKIIEKGADVNHVTKDKNNALHRVFHRVRDKRCDPKAVLDIMRLLLANGFQHLNQPSTMGITATHYAVRFKSLNEDILEFLHEHGADFNVADHEGTTVLLLAIECNHKLNIVHKIVEFGGNLHQSNQNMQNALHFAAKYGNYSAMSYVIKKLNANSVDNNCRTPLHMLFSRSNVNYQRVLELLLEKGANLDLKDNFGNIPLVHWIKFGKNPLSSVLPFKTTILNSNNVASIVIRTLIREKHVLRYYLFSSIDNDRRKVFVQFFSALIERGAKLYDHDDNRVASATFLHELLLQFKYDLFYDYCATYNPHRY